VENATFSNYFFCNTLYGKKTYWKSLILDSTKSDILMSDDPMESQPQLSKSNFWQMFYNHQKCNEIENKFFCDTLYSVKICFYKSLTYVINVILIQFNRLVRKFIQNGCWRTNNKLTLSLTSFWVNCHCSTLTIQGAVSKLFLHAPCILQHFFV